MAKRGHRASLRPPPSELPAPDRPRTGQDVTDTISAEPAGWPTEVPDAPLLGRFAELATVIAPTTVITALLVYFGFIGTRARFAYFGVYLELTDLSNQDLVFYGLEVLYFPAAVLFLTILAAAVAHAAVTWLLATPHRTSTNLNISAVVALVGLILIGRAVIGLLIRRVAQEETPGTTALALAVGPVLMTYGFWIAARTTAHLRDNRAYTFITWYASRPVRRLRRIAAIAVAGLVLAGLFWAATSFAWSVGQGRAYDDALKLPNQPEVVLYTSEPLDELPTHVTQTQLPPAPDRTYRYRYNGMRLLLEAGGRLFLVPAQWTASSRTMIIPYDSQIRIEVVPPAPSAGR